MFLFGPLSMIRRLFSLAVLAAIIYVVTSGFQVVKASHLPTSVASLTPAKAAVVLGAPADGDQPGGDLLGRLQEGLLLYQDRLAPRLLVSDPAGPSPAPSVAAVAAAWLEHQGVPASAITPLPQGNAAQALAAATELLGAGSKVLVVTDAIDALWTKGAASSAGLEPVVAPALGSEKPVYEEVLPLLSQAAGVAAGRIIGYGRASWAAS